MYEDDELFSAALELLERTFGQRRKLVEALGAVTLLVDDKLPVLGSVSKLSSTIGFLTFLARSSEVWGVNSRVSGPFDKTKYSTVQENCESLRKFIFDRILEVKKQEVP